MDNGQKRPGREKTAPKRAEARPHLSGSPNIPVALILIALVGFAVYANSLPNPLIWDDQNLIVNNARLRDFSGLGKLFTENISAGSNRMTRFYRPLQMATYMIDFRLWKLTPAGYHVTSIIWHILAAWCVFALIRTLFRDRLLALLTGLLFVVHPVHTEAVTYISGRSDPIGLVFLLLTLIFYIKASGSDVKPTDALLMLLCHAAGLLSREQNLILPALAWIALLPAQKRTRPGLLFSLIVLDGIYLLARTTVLQASLQSDPVAAPFLERLPGFFVALTTYARLLVWPFDLHMQYGYTVFAWTKPAALLGIGLFAGLLWAALGKNSKDPLARFGAAWFLLALLPVSNLYSINAYMAEHWLYAPSIGFFLWAAGKLRNLAQKPATRTLGLAVTVSLLFSFGALTVLQNARWKDPFSFYRRLLIYAPRAPQIYYNLGLEYEKADNPGEAIASYREALEIKPDYAEAAANLSVLYNNAGRYAEAADCLEKALRESPDDKGLLFNLGKTYGDLGEDRKSESLLKQLLEKDPRHAAALNELATLLARRGDLEEAATLYAQAVAAEPAFVTAVYNLAKAYQLLGRAEESKRLYRRTLQLDPDYVEAYNNLGLLLSQEGKYDEAVGLYRKAIDRMPAYPWAHLNLAFAYLKTGRLEEARAAFIKTTEVKPDLAIPYAYLSAIAFNKDGPDASRRYMDRARALGYDGETDPQRLLESLP